ncbi:signal transduction protein (plasmid) [Cupriavidus sp. USMAHM13]|uniref:CBS domain-containing protein n=1 Tax=Cupriavidus sp. USMAHM13 TaxID=1389192 RepID=UPI0008A6B7D5|nr:CBS domain-containing protein [Cupriavidus sp. USMAHM13]AOZ04370.1 signal transduction protein [Cupriavidus sp. USMAHM13]
MKVQDLCARQTVHIPFSCTLQEAAIQMRDRHVGALVVTERAEGGARAVGMVTDRDIVLDGTATGADPCQATVGDVMTRGLVTIGREAGLDDAMQAMLSHGVRRLAVVDGEAVVGVLSMDDMVASIAAELGMLSSLLRDGQEHERSGAVQGRLPA